jgi:hypothetical protein
VSDVVDALVKLAEHPGAEGRVVNIGNDGEEITMLDLARRVKERTASRSEIVLVPYAQAYEEGFEDMPRRVPDLERIRALIGYEPRVHLDEILDRVIEYFTSDRPGPDHSGRISAGSSPRRSTARPTVLNVVNFLWSALHSYLTPRTRRPGLLLLFSTVANPVPHGHGRGFFASTTTWRRRSPAPAGGTGALRRGQLRSCSCWWRSSRLLLLSSRQAPAGALVLARGRRVSRRA